MSKFPKETSRDDDDLSLRRMPRSPENGPPHAKYRRVEINTSVNMHPQSLYSGVAVQGSSESHMNGQSMPVGSSAQELIPTPILRLNTPNPQLAGIEIVIDDSSDVNVAADSGLAGEIDLSLSRMPHSPEDGTPRAHAVEINPNPMEMRPQLLQLDVVSVRVQDSSENHMNGQPIRRGSSPQEPGSSNNVIVIDDSSDEEVAVEVQDSSDSHMNGQPIPGGSAAQEPGPSNLRLNKPYLQPCNVIVIDDSSDEDVAASSLMSSSVRHMQRNFTPRNFTNHWTTKEYFFERFGFSKSDFLKDSFVDNFKQKLNRQHEKYDIKRRELAEIIEKARRARKVHDRAMLDRIFNFQFDKSPVFLIDYDAELKPLTKEHLQQYETLILGSPYEVLKFNMHLRRSDILTLVGRNCLNDNVINFYMNLLVERSKQRRGELPKVYAMNTFFLQRLTLSGYQGVSRWTRKVDLFSKDIIPVPVHHRGNHWCMAIIHMLNKTIRYYDSMGQSNQPVLDALESYLKQESLNKRQRPFDTSSFMIESVRSVPQQTNSYDCGVFCCMFAEYITRNAPIKFTQKAMPYFRKRMVLEIIGEKLWD